jgi:hypothetical protein
MKSVKKHEKKLLKFLRAEELRRYRNMLNAGKSLDYVRRRYVSQHPLFPGANPRLMTPDERAENEAHRQAMIKQADDLIRRLASEDLDRLRKLRATVREAIARFEDEQELAHKLESSMDPKIMGELAACDSDAELIEWYVAYEREIRKQWKRFQAQ